MSFAGIPVSFQPVPTGGGVLDSGSLSPLPGGGVGTDLPDLESYFNASGYSMNPTGQAPSVLPSTQPTQPTTQNAPSFWSNLNPFSPNFNPSAAGQQAAGVPSAQANSTNTFFDNPARIGTVVAGLVFLAAGVFLLAKGPAVNIVTGAAKNLAVGA